MRAERVLDATGCVMELDGGWEAECLGWLSQDLAVCPWGSP